MGHTFFKRKPLITKNFIEWRRDIIFLRAKTLPVILFNKKIKTIKTVQTCKIESTNYSIIFKKNNRCYVSERRIEVYSHSAQRFLSVNIKVITALFKLLCSLWIFNFKKDVLFNLLISQSCSVWDDRLNPKFISMVGLASIF